MDDKINQGIHKTIDLLNETIVSHTENGYTITVDAKPEILTITGVQESQDLTQLKSAINNALTKVRLKMVEKINQTIK